MGVPASFTHMVDQGTDPVVGGVEFHVLSLSDAARADDMLSLFFGECRDHKLRLRL